MSNIESQIQKFFKEGALVNDEDMLYLADDTDILIIHVNTLPIIILSIEYSTDNCYIGFDPDDNEYPLADCTLILYKVHKN